MSTEFFIRAYGYINWTIAILTFINLGWLLEMVINSYIQRSELATYVKKTIWKRDLIVSLILSLVGLITLWLPNFISNFGIEIYLISGFTYAIETFFLVDLYKILHSYIKESWFLRSSIIGIVISSISLAGVIAYYIASNAIYL